MESVFKFFVGHFPILHCFTEVLSDFCSDPRVDLAIHQLMAELHPLSSVNILVLGSAHLVPEMEDLRGLRTRYATAYVWTRGKVRHIHWHVGHVAGAGTLTVSAAGVGIDSYTGWRAGARTLSVWATGEGIDSRAGARTLSVWATGEGIDSYTGWRAGARTLSVWATGVGIDSSSILKFDGHSGDGEGGGNERFHNIIN
jgi:hypothetical protein